MIRCFTLLLLSTRLSPSCVGLKQYQHLGHNILRLHILFVTDSKLVVSISIPGRLLNVITTVDCPGYPPNLLYIFTNSRLNIPAHNNRFYHKMVRL